ncbi:MAG: bifunctional [glutamate--ammonia ligase]-adenylyl-L-tyrosine phosphorylase/[glutamate--ammonia-ligase] adenylyltransferase [Betaproteobacteria bacterium]|jgi:glutamate-ammonia-ligase adenylyltransferase|nr:bifunctional [glutamate--ammonia ligase]-adenylyl-L-tyrosine phosphorylase/[glutamate--ammonia-ligase] adenylyltransferase [Betaproteobacteria bacterium]
MPEKISPADALRFSRFAQRLCAAQPELGEEVGKAAEAGWTPEEMRAFLAVAPLDDEPALAVALRRLRQRVMLRLAVRDLGNLAPLSEVMATMSDLAEVAIATAQDFHSAALEASLGVPSANGQRQELIVIGMGKLGGRELNVSSDVDLVFAYPEEGDVEGPRPLSNHEYFARLGTKIIGSLNEITADGQVFRVDMRLRPWGDPGPLVCSFDALENYLVAQGREWERYAWIKARAITGGRAKELAEVVRPFVFRKYLDFASIGAVRSLHAQIRREVKRRDLAGDVKLGPGGIREIEFIAQALQLIRGGRDTALQARPTLTVLEILGTRGILPQTAVGELSEAYEFLRRLEHRLQWLDDAQTHALPTGAEDRQLIAESMGHADWQRFQTVLEERRAAVTRHFENIFAEQTEESTSIPLWQGSLEPEAAAEELANRGFAAPDDAMRRLTAFRTGSRYQQLPETSKQRLDKLVPRVIDEAAKTADPGTTLPRCLDFIESVSRRASYLALLQEHPQALERVAAMLASSSWAATYLTRHPIVLDELLDARVLFAEPDLAAFSRSLREAMSEHADDPETQMNLMREIHHGLIFRLLAQDLAGELTVERLADYLSLAADIVLATTIDVTWKRLANRHRDAPWFAIVGYGKLGGKELGYASDLDLVFLYDDSHDAAPEIYARLGQRINSWVTTTTPSGTLFETDLRLRPNGEGGLLVSSLDAFRRYQRESAWVWEHQALTRARFCAGDAQIGALFEEERKSILTAERDPADLATEVLAMRRRMHEGHPNRSDLFDVKHDRGGMIDIEFVVQFLVLAYSNRHAELVGNLGNIALLSIMAGLGLVPVSLAERVRAAYRDYRRLQHRLRLNGAPYARVPLPDVATHVAATRALWQAVLGPYEASSGVTGD